MQIIVKISRNVTKALLALFLDLNVFNRKIYLIKTTNQRTRIKQNK